MLDCIPTRAYARGLLQQAESREDLHSLCLVPLGISGQSAVILF